MNLYAMFCDGSFTKEGELYFKPNLSLPAVFELSYHANTIAATFALESIIGNHALST